MRIRLLAIWLVIGGAILVAYFLSSNRTLSPDQLVEVKSVCTQCHSSVPAYDKAVTVHDIHSTFNCSRCHNDGGLKTATAIHRIFQWLGISIGAISLGGVITSFIVVSKKRGK